MPDEAPDPGWLVRAGDYALLGFAAIVAIVSMVLVVSRASLLADVSLATLSAVLVVTGHGVLRMRRGARQAAYDAERAVRESELLRVAAESETRQQRLTTFSRLAAELAHEVRNPLTSIVLNTELLEDELHACIHASPEVKRLARAIGAEAERLSVLTDEYLTLARMPQPASQPQRLGDVVDEVACFNRGTAARAGVAVSVANDPKAMAVIDARLVRQLLLNLVRNALDVVPPGGHINLRTGVDGDCVTLDVVDSGPGVPTEIRHAIFEPFVSSKPHGTGLGLAVARRVARDHGGDLVLMPTASGAWFRVTLPGASPGRGAVGATVQAS
jgi:signal transduction histidine kinase